MLPLSAIGAAVPIGERRAEPVYQVHLAGGRRIDDEVAIHRHIAQRQLVIDQCSGIGDHAIHAWTESAAGRDRNVDLRPPACRGHR